MHWILACHIIAMVAWFAGLFYLPRLFVYHAMSAHQPTIDTFKTMERKLYFGIMIPAALLTTIFGIWLLSFHLNDYLHASWMQYKLIAVGLLWIYQIICGYYWWRFKHDKNHHSHLFFRWFNEVPTVLLIVIILLVMMRHVVKCTPYSATLKMGLGISNFDHPDSYP